MKLIFAEAGSGAKHHVPIDVIKAIKKEVNIPLIVGGGIRTPESAANVFRAGANIVVVGNSFEKDPELIMDIAATRFNFKDAV
jgi:geranylgeranylglyceryl phosphate synthase family protein